MQSDFSHGPVWRRILSQAIPLTLASLVQLLYNIVDRIYLGHLPGADSLALTGVGLTFPIVSLIAAFTNLFARGGTPLFSIARGARENDRASRIMGAVFTLLLSSSFLIMAVCLAFRRPVLYLFGASDASYAYADTYLRIYLLGTPLAMLATGLNGFINAQGYAQVGMMTTVSGAVVNLILAQLFIFALDMGVAGAALATVISQGVSCLWVLCFLRGRRIPLPLRRGHMRVELPMLRQILALGTSGFIMQGTNCLVQIACNTTLQAFGGDLYVGIMTVLQSIRSVLEMPVFGVTSGSQPVIGYNYGARKYSRVRESIRFTSAIGAAYTLLIWIALLIFPRAFVSIFSNDPALLDAAPHALNLYFFGYVFMSLQFAGQTTFQALGHAKHAIFFSLLRKAFIVVPLTLLLPRIGFGVDGVFLAEPISNLIGGAACFFTMLRSVYLPLGKAKDGSAPA